MRLLRTLPEAAVSVGGWVVQDLAPRQPPNSCRRALDLGCCELMADFMVLGAMKPAARATKRSESAANKWKSLSLGWAVGLRA